MVTGRSVGGGPVVRNEDGVPQGGCLAIPFKVLIHRWIPTQLILHPFPSVRFDATCPR
jgi:hypothetical protein